MPLTLPNTSLAPSGQPAPLTATVVGGTDGASIQILRLYDADSGAGVEFVQGVMLRQTGAGGSVEVGTAAQPLRIDPTGTTTQPISAAALPLPAGAATEATLATRATEATLATRASEATLATRLADATFTGRINTQGQKTMAGSTPMVIASDQSAIPVTGAVTTTPPVSGTHGNAWNAAAVGAGGTSASIDTQYTPFVSIFGNADAATTITIQYSQDNANFYNGPTLAIPALGSDFASDITVGARYVRLQSSGAATITATVAGKGG